MARSSIALVSALCAAATALPAGAQLSTRARLESLVLAAEPEVLCAAPLSLLAWADPSDARTFAVHPTARLDDQELAAAHFRDLLELAIVGGLPRLYVVGAPVGTPLPWFSSFGWRVRWPFC